MKKAPIDRVFILFFLALGLFFSCGENHDKSSDETTVSDTTVSENTVTPNDETSIGTFSTFPPEIDGCACYFSNDEAAFKSKIYIYADDYGNKAFVNINGIMTTFALTKSDTLPDNRYVKTFANEKYEIIIDVKPFGQIDETWQQEGIMSIKPKDGETIIKKIHGECGC